MKVKNISLALIVLTYKEGEERKTVHLNPNATFENDNLTAQDVKVYVPKEIEILEGETETDKTETDKTDDLTAVAGVGTATATKLAEHGVTTFKALAELTEEKATELAISAEIIASAKALLEEA